MNSSNMISGVGPYDQLIQQCLQLQSQAQFCMGQMSEVGPHGDQDLNSQSSEPAIDEFGLCGLLKVIRMNNPNLNSLALGLDLTTLGLNLNASDNIHKSFASPWAEESHKGEPQYSIPECYYAKQLPVLNVSSFNLILCSHSRNSYMLAFLIPILVVVMYVQQAHFAKFRLATLFYIFYRLVLSLLSPLSPNLIDSLLLLFPCAACREKRHSYMQLMNCMSLFVSLLLHI